VFTEVSGKKKQFKNKRCEYWFKEEIGGGQVSYQNCEHYSTLEFLKKRQNELEKEYLGLLTSSPYSPMDQDRVFRQKLDVLVAINNRKEMHCSHCYNADCPYYMEGVRIRLRRNYKV